MMRRVCMHNSEEGHKGNDDSNDSDEYFLLGSPIFRHAATAKAHRGQHSMTTCTTSTSSEAANNHKKPQNNSQTMTNLPNKVGPAKKHSAEENAHQKVEANEAKKLERAARKEEKIQEQQDGYQAKAGMTVFQTTNQGDTHTTMK
eukprot:scaffold33878_cov74-Attheya_sp.AAC.1